MFSLEMKPPLWIFDKLTEFIYCKIKSYIKLQNWIYCNKTITWRVVQIVSAWIGSLVHKLQILLVYCIAYLYIFTHLNSRLWFTFQKQYKYKKQWARKIRIRNWIVTLLLNFWIWNRLHCMNSVTRCSNKCLLWRLLYITNGQTVKCWVLLDKEIPWRWTTVSMIYGSNFYSKIKITQKCFFSNCYIIKNVWLKTIGTCL